VRTTVLLIVLGLVMIFASSFIPTVGQIITDSVNAVAVQVCYYYGIAGLVCAWVYRNSRAHSLGTWMLYALYPFVSAVALIGLGIYACTTFNTITLAVGIGGLVIGIVFFRPKRWGEEGPPPAPAE
jgi:hypothetical protein